MSWILNPTATDWWRARTHTHMLKHARTYTQNKQTWLHSRDILLAMAHNWLNQLPLRVENLSPGRKDEPPPPNEGLPKGEMGEKAEEGDDRPRKGFLIKLIRLKLEPLPRKREELPGKPSLLLKPPKLFEETKLKLLPDRWLAVLPKDGLRPKLAKGLVFKNVLKGLKLFPTLLLPGNAAAAKGPRTAPRLFALPPKNERLDSPVEAEANDPPCKPFSPPPAELKGPGNAPGNAEFPIGFALLPNWLLLKGCLVNPFAFPNWLRLKFSSVLGLPKGMFPSKVGLLNPKGVFPSWKEFDPKGVKPFWLALLFPKCIPPPGMELLTSKRKFWPWLLTPGMALVGRLPLPAAAPKLKPGWKRAGEELDKSFDATPKFLKNCGFPKGNLDCWFPPKGKLLGCWFPKDGTPDCWFPKDGTPDCWFWKGGVPDCWFPKEGIPDCRFPPKGELPGCWFLKGGIFDCWFPNGGNPDCWSPPKGELPVCWFPKNGVPDCWFPNSGTPDCWFPPKGELPVCWFPKNGVPDCWFPKGGMPDCGFLPKGEPPGCWFLNSGWTDGWFLLNDDLVLPSKTEDWAGLDCCRRKLLGDDEKVLLLSGFCGELVLGLGPCRTMGSTVCKFLTSVSASLKRARCAVSSCSGRSALELEKERFKVDGVLSSFEPPATLLPLMRANMLPSETADGVLGPEVGEVLASETVGDALPALESPSGVLLPLEATNNVLLLPEPADVLLPWKPADDMRSPAEADTFNSFFLKTKQNKTH